MAFEGWGKLFGAQLDLKLIPPPVEYLLGILGEPHGGDAFLFFTARAKVLGVQGIKPLEDLVGSVLRLRIWPAVHVAPARRRIGPDQQLKPLQQAVIALLSLGSLIYVGREGPRLDAAQD